MLSHRKDIRIWHITVTWKNYTQQLRKEFIVTAPDENEAKQLVTNRLPTHLLSQPDKQGQIRVRDLGTVNNEKTYFSSEPFVPNNRQDDAPQYERVILYARMWGSELGWRSTNQASTQQDDDYLQKMKNETNLIPMLNDWAKQSMYSIDKSPEDFFLTKMSEYLGTKVINITDMIPVSERRYDKLVKNAELQAQSIIYEAQQKANKIEQEARDIKREAQRDKTLVEQMLNALKNGTMAPNVPISTTTNTIDQPLPDDPQTENPESEPKAQLLDIRQVVDEPTDSETTEKPINDPEETQNETIYDPQFDENDEDEDENDLGPEEEPYGLVTAQEWPTNDPFNGQDIPGWDLPPDEMPEVVSESTEPIETDSGPEIPKQTEVQKEEDSITPTIPPLLTGPDTEEEIESNLSQTIEETDEAEAPDVPEPVPQQPEVIPTAPYNPIRSPMMKSSNLSENAIEATMRNWKFEELQKAAHKLTIKIIRDRKVSHEPALANWGLWLKSEHINKNHLKHKNLQVEYFIQFIKECEEIDGVPPLVYVYHKYTGQEHKLFQDQFPID